MSKTGRDGTPAANAMLISDASKCPSKSSRNKDPGQEYGDAALPSSFPVRDLTTPRDPRQDSDPVPGLWTGRLGAPTSFFSERSSFCWSSQGSWQICKWSRADEGERLKKKRGGGGVTWLNELLHNIPQASLLVLVWKLHWVLYRLFLVYASLPRG